MIGNRLFSAMLLVLAVCISASPALSSELSLTGIELRALVGHGEVRFSNRVVSGITRYSPNGNASTELTIGVSDTGKWWISEDQVCVQWSHLRSGTTKCFRVFVNGENTYRTSHGFTLQGN